MYDCCSASYLITTGGRISLREELLITDEQYIVCHLTVTMGGGSCSRLVLEAKLAVQFSGIHDTILLQS